MSNELNDLYDLPDHLRHLAYFTTILEACNKDWSNTISSKLEELYEDTLNHCLNNGIKLSIVFPQKEYNKPNTNEQ
jgi:hypothetical protein